MVKAGGSQMAAIDEVTVTKIVETVAVKYEGLVIVGSVVTISEIVVLFQRLVIAERL